MSTRPTPLWRWSAVELAAAIARREVSCREATASVLARIEAVNPRINALADVMASAALQAADAADAAVHRGDVLGPLHGVPVTLKINVDCAGRATTGGIAAFKDLIAHEDAPAVSNLKRAGAVIVGRNNAPAFSLRWFTDNDVHGRTLNPFDATRTPGGSSGGAAAAVATGMGAIALGSDYGGSIRHPAYCCGVVGLRPTAGRVPAFNATSKDERLITNQLMSVQGPLARTVADARVALHALAQADARDPLWVPAPLQQPLPKPLRVALCKTSALMKPDATVVTSLERAARWLQDAGCVVEEAEPPHQQEASVLWRQLVFDDLRHSGLPAINAFGDAPVQAALQGYLHGLPELNRGGYLSALQRRLTIARAWSLFFERYPLLLTAVSWQTPFAIDADIQGPERMAELLAAQSPLLSTAGLGLPGISVPTGIANGLPTGVQLVATRYREDLLLHAAQMIEVAAGFDVLGALG
jgi:amidase